MKNEAFLINFDNDGTLNTIVSNKDQEKMNWLISGDYLNSHYPEHKNKKFGTFYIQVNEKSYTNENALIEMKNVDGIKIVSYEFDEFKLNYHYDLSKAQIFKWTISVESKVKRALRISDFTIWLPLAYVMYRENDLQRQTKQSCAVFPTIASHYTKLACVKRGNIGPHLGVFQTEGKTQSLGTYCAYENLFFENVSPSLDGMLFHQLILAGGYPRDFKNNDWIYSKEPLVLENNKMKSWSYEFKTFENHSSFYQEAEALEHPIYDYEPLAIHGQPYSFKVKIPPTKKVETIISEYVTSEKKQRRDDITSQLKKNDDRMSGHLLFESLGEHKISVLFEDETEDFIVVNVMPPIATTIKERTDYISHTLYNDENADIPFSYSPISNQGESLGKLSLVLKKNLMDELDLTEVQQIEQSCVHYIKEKWFVNGNFTKPANLYGSFYRCMDFEYIGHVFYLLSQFSDEVLVLNTRDTYLEWASDVFCLRVNPELHTSKRGIEESQMLGIYFLYIDDLLTELKERHFDEKYQEITLLWQSIIEKVNEDSDTYRAAVTEHFYDNAGFGPAAGALSSMKLNEGASKYGELLLANIGFSNDFRAQNPDRWWEALSYMIHSLWGGVTAAATLKVYEALHDTRYLKAAYRATIGILYCYDTNATATNKQLQRGEAASTYSVAGPNLNRPDLSRNRFGQSTFYQDGGIFSKLFKEEAPTADWDMGEEFVAYLDGFGKKTFIYRENDEIKVINGTISKNQNGYKIESFAPYPLEYHFYDDNEHYHSINNESVPSIYLIDGKFTLTTNKGV